MRMGMRQDLIGVVVLAALGLAAVPSPAGATYRIAGGGFGCGVTKATPWQYADPTTDKVVSSGDVWHYVLEGGGRSLCAPAAATVKLFTSSSTASDQDETILKQNGKIVGRCFRAFVGTPQENGANTDVYYCRTPQVFVYLWKAIDRPTHGAARPTGVTF